MTETTANGHDTHAADHAPAPPPPGLRRLTAPGWLRAAWTTPLFGFSTLGLVCLIRWAAHWNPIWKSQPIVTVATMGFPLGLLIGIGAFDYWSYYVAGK